MRANIRHIMTLLLFSTIFAAATGCDDTLEFANTPPGGLKISRDRCYLGPDDSVTLMGEATDNDGDEISYSWTAEAGTLTPADGMGQAVVWRAPGSHGTYRVTLRVTDQIDVSSKGIDIDVGRALGDFHDGVVLDETDYPYIVPNALPINIRSLETLTIEAGVTIVFNEYGGGFTSEGAITINGTAADKVLMIPNTCPGVSGKWNGIRLTGNMSNCTWSHATLSSADNALTVENEASLTADNLILDQASDDGLTVKSGAVVIISDSRIWDNGGGVYVSNATLQITTTSIRYNGDYGLTLTHSGGTYPFGVDVLSCVVANNVSNGFILVGIANPVVNNCSLFLNGPDINDIRTVRFLNTYANTSPVDMTGCFWGAYTAQEIQAQIIREGANGTVDYSGWLSEEP